MESLPDNVLYEFQPDTLKAVRKIYDLDDPEKMKEAIDILDDWVRKQHHFVKKDFDRNYLERIIITTKGSLENAKKHLDRRCALKTLMPELFQVCNVKEDFQDLFKMTNVVFLPKLTSDYYRIIMVKTDGLGDFVNKYYRYIIMMAEYMKTYDYNNGIVFIFDFRNADVLELVSSLKVNELSQMLEILLQGYGYSIKAFHILTSPKTCDALMGLIKEVYSTKHVKRVRMHSTVEEMFEYVPRDYLPKDYGGKEKSLTGLSNDWIKEISSKKFIEYLKVMYKAGINESLRPNDVFKNKGLATPGF